MTINTKGVIHLENISRVMPGFERREEFNVSVMRP